MYLSKQWRESRIISAIAVLGLGLLLFTFIKVNFFLDPSHFNHNPRQIAGAVVTFALSIFYIEAALVGFWGWLAASIGVGKNLGEESGSFLLTRTRRRAWFLWSDWGFAMALIAIIILITNLIFGFWLERILVVLHTPSRITLTDLGQPIPLVYLMIILSLGCLLFAGLIYSVSYFSTIVLKRQMGVVLGAGILAGYVALSALLQHYYSVDLPSLMPNPYHISRYSNGIADHLTMQFAIRAVLMLLFPLAAQVVLDRSEI